MPEIGEILNKQLEATQGLSIKIDSFLASVQQIIAFRQDMPVPRQLNQQPLKGPENYTPLTFSGPIGQEMPTGENRPIQQPYEPPPDRAPQLNQQPARMDGLPERQTINQQPILSAAPTPRINQITYNPNMEPPPIRNKGGGEMTEQLEQSSDSMKEAADAITKTMEKLQNWLESQQDKAPEKQTVGKQQEYNGDEVRGTSTAQGERAHLDRD